VSLPTRLKPRLGTTAEAATVSNAASAAAPSREFTRVGRAGRRLALLATLVAAGCADLDFTTAVGTIPVPITNPSWRLDLAPVIGETCATSQACHMGPNPGGFISLEPSQSRANLVNVPSFWQPAYLRVRPGQPDSSFFYLVTSSVPSERLNYYRMPMTEYPLPDAVRQTIRNWIADGALDN